MRHAAHLQVADDSRAAAELAIDAAVAQRLVHLDKARVERLLDVPVRREVVDQDDGQVLLDVARYQMPWEL